MKNYSIIKKIWITEKSASEAEIRKYAFLVAKDANKSEVKKAVRDIYHVTATKVCVSNTPGKKRRMGSVRGHGPGHKKAVVTLKVGESIDLR